MRALLLVALLLGLPAWARAQDGAALVADTLVLTADGLLVATGNVQAFYEGTTLSAERVTYDPDTDRLRIDGPILLRDPEGNVLAADRADLDARLEQGLLAGARAVLGRQFQIAAERVEQGGRTTEFSSVAATSCQVCPGRAPLWEIRAGRVIRDEVAEVLTFEDAQFLVRGVPILWLPRFRLPEPGNERATGLLLPRLRGSGELGLGIELPYFVELGDSRDLTLAPFLSPATATLGARYREAFLNGTIEASGAVSADDLRPGRTRAFLAADGAFALPGDLDLAFAATVASDESYLSDYGLGEAGAVESELRLARVGDRELLEGGVSVFQFPEQGDPDALGDLSWERRAALGGGTLTWGASLDTVLRGGTAPGDVLRVGSFAGWHGQAVLGPGIVLEGESRLDVDAFRFGNGEGSAQRAVPAARVTLRWPLVRHGAGEAADLVEPLATLAWAERLGEDPPDNDSRRPELDEGNLFALSRLPGEDAVEEGGRLALGAAWTREAPAYASTFTVGRLLGAEAPALGVDWLAAGRLEVGAGLALEGRTLLGGGGGLALAEARLDWESAAASVEAGYSFVSDAYRPDGAGSGEELAFDGEFRPSERWTFRTEARYDLGQDRPRRLGVGVEWRNECVEVDLSVARRYTSADGGEPSTDFGLSLGLLGFSIGDTVTPGACRG